MMKKPKLLPIYAPKGKCKTEFDLINYNLKALDHNLDMKLGMMLEEINKVSKSNKK